GVALVPGRAGPLVLAPGGARACGTLPKASAGSSVAGDIGMPRKAPRAREAASADTDAAPGAAPRPVARTPPPDDEPIPY
ncbi:MAG: hypothetical protein ACKOF7_03430, partial [Phycisphaerales bacterium]